MQIRVPITSGTSIAWGLIRMMCSKLQTSIDKLKPANAVILAMAHDQYRTKPWQLVSGLLERGQGAVANVRNVLARADVPEGIVLWRL